MYEECIKLLERKKIELQDGLTSGEITNIENIYKIKFPMSLRNFLMITLPVSKGFYNWRNMEENNIVFIKKMINRPKEIIYELAREIYWCDDWGEEPDSEIDMVRMVRKKLKNAPKLLPIYGHRYMPMLSTDDPPVISIHGVDVIYYGENLEDYFKIEFGGKEQSKILFRNIKPIPFWSDIM